MVKLKDERERAANVYNLPRDAVVPKNAILISKIFILILLLRNEAFN